MEVNLPGTGDTVIKQAIPPGVDSAFHLKHVIAQTERERERERLDGLCVYIHIHVQCF